MIPNRRPDFFVTLVGWGCQILIQYPSPSPSPSCVACHPPFARDNKASPSLPASSDPYTHVSPTPLLQEIVSQPFPTHQLRSISHVSPATPSARNNKTSPSQPPAQIHTPMRRLTHPLQGIVRSSSNVLPASRESQVNIFSALRAKTQYKFPPRFARQ